VSIFPRPDIAVESSILKAAVRYSGPVALLQELICPDGKWGARRVEVIVGDDDARYGRSAGADRRTTTRQVQIIRCGV
jgi:hypothetical protein